MAQKRRNNATFEDTTKTRNVDQTTVPVPAGSNPGHSLPQRLIEESDDEEDENVLNISYLCLLGHSIPIGYHCPLYNTKLCLHHQGYGNSCFLDLNWGTFQKFLYVRVATDCSKLDSFGHSLLQSGTHDTPNHDLQKALHCNL